MKPFEEISRLREIVTDPRNCSPDLGSHSTVVDEADRLLAALRRSASSLRQKINGDAFRQLEQLNLLVPAHLNVPVEPELPDDPEKSRLALLGILAKLEQYFSAATFGDR